MTILLVEDDRAIRDSLHDLLMDEGYSVSAAKSVEEALDVLARDRPPCLILLDLMMPRMDGRTLLATLKSDPDLQRIPVVVMTAARVFEAPGAAAVLRKPFHVDAVLELVEQFCAGAPRSLHSSRLEGTEELSS